MDSDMVDDDDDDDFQSVNSDDAAAEMEVPSREAPAAPAPPPPSAARAQPQQSYAVSDDLAEALEAVMPGIPTATRGCVPALRRHAAVGPGPGDKTLLSPRHRMPIHSRLNKHNEQGSSCVLWGAGSKLRACVYSYTRERPSLSKHARR